MILLDGKIAASAIKEKLKTQITQATKKAGRPPHLAAILVGNDGASETYVASKIKNCALTGIKSSLVRLADTVSEQELIEAIKKLNTDDDVDGILVQLPLPAHIKEEHIISVIAPHKDVDGFHPVNAGKLMLDQKGFIPATPLGIMLLLQHYHLETSGKHAVVIGRSNIVGRPMSILLSRNNNPGNCTVTLTHSRTKNLPDICRQADIIVAALGKPGFLTSIMVKPGAVIIDVGITRVKDETKLSGYSLKGDVDFASVSQTAGYITPVPGGVGLMTIAALLTNTYEAFLNHTHQ